MGSVELSYMSNLQSGLSAPIKRYYKPFKIIAYNMVLHKLLSTGGKNFPVNLDS